jgi:integrase/recombinase XerD
MHDYAQRLRAFFRFAEARGWCTLGVANGIIGGIG